MPVLNRIAAFADDMTEWRRWMHRHPELGFDCHRTAAFVADKLRAFGVDELHEGIATTGVVGIIEGSRPGPTIGLRADMDALPMPEQTGAAHASEVPGAMHACGHDGHTAMLLGAARYLAETRNFAGRVALIFQPAEEAGGGGRVMVEEGIMDRFAIAEVYALHNAPDLPEGHFATTPGPIMAAVDEFAITVRGVGGHAAWPHECRDPVPVAVRLAHAFDTIVSRDADPIDRLVVSVTQIHAGTAFNVIPDSAFVGGTVRTFTTAMRGLAERRIAQICTGLAQAFGVTVDLEYRRDYPATVNHAREAMLAADIAASVVGEDRVIRDTRPSMGAEDFAYMLEARPGAYLNLGQGGGPMCHHPAYDFNDAIAPVGASFFARMVEMRQPA
ncbi:amidohydrolase family protein [Oceaniovalibus guishaninsula JLT2003]|uniref:Amidohydrolase family protein n=1 Tax=Oceaniovalibus guishaninsula JLT2003 TaxID=1231392 RepID=K2IA06_9RHOB|nr:M20 aminoacylase family protein [Oceaniovalibus guishaninsula]EKE45810.1 amidohydrolase family protein [Oceaniovalibus guishaninsula JLT2003]